MHKMPELVAAVANEVGKIGFVGPEKLSVGTLPG